MKFLFFTKDRPMQFRGFVESFLHYVSPVNPKDVTVITPYSTKETYSDIIDEFKDFNWFFEDDFGGFQKALEFYLSTLTEDDYVLPGCDDCVYMRDVELTRIEKLLKQNKDAIGFSLRLNIKQPAVISFENINDSGYLKCLWTHSSGDYGYPFELMGTVYPAKVMKMIFHKVKPIRLPNDYEAKGFEYCLTLKDYKPYLLIDNDFSALAACDVNRVQDLYPNSVDPGGQALSAGDLLEKYQEGYRMDWTVFKDHKPERCFMGGKNFTMVKR